MKLLKETNPDGLEIFTVSGLVVPLIDTVETGTGERAPTAMFTDGALESLGRSITHLMIEKARKARADESED